jgi:hypothetical protein
MWRLQLPATKHAACRPPAHLPQGVLFPSYHMAYWIGLQAANWPLFSWIDPGTPGINTAQGYKNWGFLNGGVGRRPWLPASCSPATHLPPAPPCAAAAAPGPQAAPGAAPKPQLTRPVPAAVCGGGGSGRGRRRRQRQGAADRLQPACRSGLQRHASCP